MYVYNVRVCMYCIALSCIASYCITHACISISVNGKLQEWHIKTDSTTNRDMFLAGPSILYMTWFMSKTVRKMRLSADLIGCCARYASVMLRWSGVRWGEVGWGGVRWGEVGWGGMRWGEVGWGGVGLITFLCSAWWLSYDATLTDVLCYSALSDLLLRLRIP